MDYPTETEVAAMMAGAEAGGAYLDALTKTDMADMQPEEWMTFIEAVCTGFCDHVQGAGGTVGVNNLPFPVLPANNRIIDADVPY